MDGVTYKVKEGEAVEDVFLTPIEKYGDVVEFTPVDMLNEQRQLEKLITELTGKLDVETAKQENILHHHPFVKDFTTQQLFTLHMYYESVSFCEALPAKIQDFKDQLERSREEYKKIAETLGLDIMPKPVEVRVDESMEKIVGPETDNGNGTEQVA